jgi:3-hydroxybutyryl-CoA dehydratase
VNLWRASTIARTSREIQRVGIRLQTTLNRHHRSGRSTILGYTEQEGAGMPYVYSKLQVGDSHVFEKTITDADVLLFAAVSGDNNPMHMNEVYARKTKFGRRIAHGALTASLVSNALTLAFPGSIYISQYSEFTAPVFIGDTVRAEVTCIEKMEKGRVRMQTNCYNQDNLTVMKGEAITRLARDVA